MLTTKNSSLSECASVSVSVSECVSVIDYISESNSRTLCHDNQSKFYITLFHSYFCVLKKLPQ